VRNAKRPSIVPVLMGALALAAVAASHAGEGHPGPLAGYPDHRAGDRLMLSLQVARARKDHGGIARYKSLLRQRLWKVRRAPGGASAPPVAGRPATGRRPSSGR
jgi:hypothetical protein